jgi:Na+-driven multidrug efflux pump
LGKYGFEISIRDLILQKKWIHQIFKLGLPSSLEMSSRSLGMFLMMFLVSTLGTVIVAAYGIGIKLLSFVIIPAMGLSISISTLVGNNLGAKQYLRAEEITKIGIKIGFWTLSFLGVFVFILAKKISVFFIPNEFEVITETTNFIRIISLTFGFIGIQMVIIGTFKGAGQTIMSMFLAIFHTLCLLILSYIFAFLFSLGSFGIWLTYPVTNVFVLIFSLFFYKQKKWLKKEIIH